VSFTWIQARLTSGTSTNDYTDFERTITQIKD